MNALEQLMADDLAAPPPSGLEPLVAALRDRLGPALRSIVLYGSTRRSDDVRDGLVDLMAVVDDYRSVHDGRLAAWINRVLPPNVYYLEAGSPEPIRCKWILVSEATLSERMRGGLDGYFWARYTQPCRCVWAVAPGARTQLARVRANAAGHFAARAAGRIRGHVDGLEFWRRAIAATYACELRPEPPGASARLVARDPDFWRRLSDLVLPSLSFALSDGDGRFELRPGRVRRAVSWLEWRARGIWSKFMNLARLLKATGTFANGVDYLCWKIERHSGVRVEPTERMRRHPRRAAVGLIWRMWRSGALKR